MTTLRRIFPTISTDKVSDDYRRAIDLVRRDIELLLRARELPIERIVWRARTAYRNCWATECERCRK